MSEQKKDNLVVSSNGLWLVKADSPFAPGNNSRLVCGTDLEDCRKNLVKTQKSQRSSTTPK